MAKNKVIWTEGLLLKPVHFQQQERYFEYLSHQYSQHQHGYSWGFDILEIDSDLLSLNKIGIKRARGVTPDGAVFDIPGTDDTPPVIDIPDTTVQETLYLCLPLRNSQYEYRLPETSDAVQRYQGHLERVDNTTSTEKDETELLVASLKFSLMLANQNTDGYCIIPCAQILKCTKNRGVVLDEDYIAPTINCQNNDRLKQQLSNITGFMVKKTVELVGRIHANTEQRYNNFEIEDLLCLQTINHFTPLLKHLSDMPVLHPEIYYRYLLMLVSELSTYTLTRTLKHIPPYRHDNLQLTFEELYQAALECIANISSRIQIIEIPITKANYGLFHGLIGSREVLQEANFVLAVKADVPAAELKAHINDTFRISTIEAIRELMVANLPGFALVPLARIPRDLPFHEGYTYFEVSMPSENRQLMIDATGFALQTGDDERNLKFQLWAVMGDLHE